MEELELSIMQRNAGEEPVLRPFLDSFQTRQRTPVRLHVLDWTRGRSEMIKMALYHHGSDVSEIGTTWISDLVAMNALRPFSASEVIQAGPAEAFLPAVWSTTQMLDQSQVWSIPWLAESYTLHYRIDLLEEAGINPETDLATPQQLLETVRVLKAKGHSLPIALPPLNARTLILHVAASWVWQSGGDFLSKDGRAVAFNDAPALEGLKTFFNMVKAISGDGLKKLESMGTVDSFSLGGAPLAIGGLWLHPSRGRDGSIDQRVWGVTRLPGPPFVGGTNLVIWKHTRQERAALSLLQMLASEATSASYANQVGSLPTRTRLSSSAQYQDDRFLCTAFQSIQIGRTYPTFSLWGLVEDRLVNAIAGLWEAIARDPDFNVDEMVPRVLNQLARSLNLTLTQR